MEGELKQEGRIPNVKTQKINMSHNLQGIQLIEKQDHREGRENKYINHKRINAKIKINKTITTIKND